MPMSLTLILKILGFPFFSGWFKISSLLSRSTESQLGPNASPALTPVSKQLQKRRVLGPQLAIKALTSDSRGVNGSFLVMPATHL
jgi:hypothetical protein